jgi:hypothetical protein
MLGDEVAARLAAQGLGTVNTDLFYNVMPDSPDVATAVLPYGGMPSEPDLGINGGVTRMEFPRFQLVTRGVRGDSEGPGQRLVLAVAAVVSVVNTNLSGVRYASITALSPPTPLTTDDGFRVLWACNLQADKDPS